MSSAEYHISDKNNEKEKMPRIEQPGIPSVKKSRAPIKTPSVDPLTNFWKDMIEQETAKTKLQIRQIELLERILDKLEEIRYGLADNETGISNLLKQMKLNNKKLEELIDKRH